MKIAALFFIALSTCCSASATQKCSELFAISGIVGIYEAHHWFEFGSWSVESEKVLPVAGAVVAHQPKIDFARLRNLLAFALENAVQHGRSSGVSEVEVSVQRVDDGLRVQILNDRWHRLPNTLKAKVFEAGTVPFLVPTCERDVSRGTLGLATGLMVSALNYLYLTPAAKTPTMCWREVDSSLTSKPKVLFELYLPD